MAVPVWIIALAKNLTIPFIRFIGIVKSVRCVKMGFSGNVDQNSLMDCLLLMLETSNWQGLFREPYKL